MVKCLACNNMGRSRMCRVFASETELVQHLNRAHKITYKIYFNLYWSEVA